MHDFCEASISTFARAKREENDGHPIDLDDTERHGERNELRQFLMMSAVQESRRYNPAVGTLRGFLVGRLRFRITDWYRSRGNGNARHRDIAPKPLSLSEPDIADQAAHDPLAAMQLDPLPAAHLSEGQAQKLQVIQMARLLGLDLWRLSPQARWAFRHIAVPLAHDESMTNIMTERRKTNGWLQEQLALLQTELRDLGIAP